MANEPAKESGDEKPIIIKRIKKGGGGHHGGAWKVAYADFVTAMMAFFLLLWLLNVTTDEQKNAIANYFDPTHPKVSESLSGAGGVMGGLSMSPKGAMATDKQSMAPDRAQRPVAGRDPTKKLTEKKADADKNQNPSIEKAKEVLRKVEEQRFKQAEQQVKQAIQDNPQLAALSKNLIVDMTPEGLRIQIVDQEGRPMFALGSAQMFEETRLLLQNVSAIIQKLPNQISVRGHTDSLAYGGRSDYTNWELSSDRANASRRTLLESGLPVKRLNNIVGKADTEPLVKDNTADPRNRRISIVLLKEELTDPDFEKKAAALAPAQDDSGAENGNKEEGGNIPGVPVGTFRKTPGKVVFP